MTERLDNGSSPFAPLTHFAPSEGPSARSGASIAYDPATSQTILLAKQLAVGAYGIVASCSGSEFFGPSVAEDGLVVA
ncbi:MAG: hypothetical protein ABSB52_06500 [Acidimicrobiales bacterium]